MPLGWKKGKVESAKIWQWLAMNILTMRALTGPTQFVIWRLLQQKDSGTVIKCLNSIFPEKGPPKEILPDYTTELKSE